MDWKAKQAAEAVGVAALVASNPHLVPAASCKGGSLIAATKNIKIELGLAFPGVKFSIKSRRFSMGDAIDVSWVDGPVSSQVDEIIGRYSAGSFNGMEDLYEYSRDFWITAFGDAKYVHSRRDMSDAAIAKAIRLVSSKYAANLAELGLPNPSLEAFKRGDYRNVQLIACSWAPGRDMLSDAILSAAYRQCYALTRPYIRNQQLEEV
jgi:hypothetical protein